MGETYEEKKAREKSEFYTNLKNMTREERGRVLSARTMKQYETSNEELERQHKFEEFMMKIHTDDEYPVSTI